MTADSTDRVQELAEVRDISESEILERVLERGVEDLWADLVLSQYIDGEIERERAVELVGHDRVNRSERETEAVEDDVRWGMNA